MGEPCNGCGVCCLIQVCRNGSYVLKLVQNLGEYVPGPCPAIIRAPDGKITCGIVAYPNRYLKKSQYPPHILSKYFAHLIGSGTGCDELLSDDTPEEEAKLDATIAQRISDSEWLEKSKKAMRIIHGV